MSSIKKINAFDNSLINPYLEFFNNIIYINTKNKKKTEHFVHDILIELSTKELKKLNNKYLSLLKSIDKFSFTEQEAERALNTLIFLQHYFYSLKNKIQNHSHPTEKQKKLFLAIQEFYETITSLCEKLETMADSEGFEILLNEKD